MSSHTNTFYGLKGTKLIQNIWFPQTNCAINKVMGPVPKRSTLWDRSHIMRDRSRLYGTGTPRTHSCVVFYDSNSMHYFVCIVFYLLYLKHCIICTVFYALHYMHFSLCILFYELYYINQIFMLYSMHFNFETCY